jgi:lycopene beta-cyclase
VDGRGPAKSPALDLAFQKFLGLEILLAAPHGLDRPILMDATVDQVEGYRFIYVLPLDTDRLLIEDTYYADAPALDVPALRRRVDAYAAARGWRIREVLREEAGVLPITLGGDIDAFWNDGVPGLPRTGLRAALFHPTTGYSLPEAVRLADHLAALPDLSSETLYTEIRAWSVRRWRSHGFFRLLNRMLFRAGAPAERFRVLSRFYGLPEPTVRRFYAGALSPADKVRLLAGKPPVPVIGAMRAILPEIRLQRS